MTDPLMDPNIPTVTVMDLANLPVDKQLKGQPDGPVAYEPTLRMNVPTYIDPRKDLIVGKHTTTLMHHVPTNMRGPWKDENGQWVICSEYSKSTDARCRLKAQNRVPLCGMHGGALHPLDKRKEVDWSDPSIPRHILFRFGKLDPELMTEEELARGSIRKEDGSWMNNKQVPIAVHDQMVRELFKRADVMLQSNLISAVQAMADIAGGTAYEPADRIKAAAWIYERVRGKVPDQIVHTQAQPWEVVFDGLAGGSRAESRAARGIEGAVDAEVVDDGMVQEYVGPPVPTDDGVSMDEYIEEEPYDEIEEAIDRERRTPEPAVRYGAAGRPETYTPDDTPPLDVRARDQVDAHHESEAERVAAEKKAFAERMKIARRKRFASQAKGLSHVEAFGYVPKGTKTEDGNRLVKFTDPKLKPVPATQLKKDRAARRNDYNG